MLRLKKLWVEHYKNLKDLTIDFESGDGFSMLIGTNGSGKSNVLELISGIFDNVFKKAHPSKVESSYKLEYTINDNEYITIERKGMSPLGSLKHTCNSISMLKGKLLEKNLLPKNVIAIYSGEETRLRDTFYNLYYSKYMKNINAPSHHIQSMQLMYINKFYWDISLVLLCISERENIKTFLKDTLQLPPIEKIIFNFNKNNISKHNNMLQAFIGSILQEKEYVSYSIEELRERLLNFEPLEDMLFHYFVQAYLPKNSKIIKSIQIQFNSQVRATELSEGEKKLILIKAVLEFLADERTLLLFDEPDSYINESKKTILYNIIKEQETSQIIMTTHSPTLTKLAKSNEKLILQTSENGSTSIVKYNNIEDLNKISGGLWTANTESIIFISQKPLILVEGSGDIKYIIRSIEVLGEIDSKYKEIDCEYLFFGGTGNAKEFIDKIQTSVSKNRKIIVIFDRDGAGSKAIKDCIGTGNNRDSDNEIYCQKNFYYFMLPKTNEHNEIDFLIEDYFKKEKKNSIVQAKINSADGHFNSYTKDLKQHLKEELEKFSSEAKASDLEGFKVLLDKIHGIIYDTINCINI